MSARKTCSPDIYNGVMVRVKPAHFTLFQEREAKKRNEEQIEWNSNFARRWNKNQPFGESRVVVILWSHSLSLFVMSSFLTIDDIQLLNNL